jgi:cytochrome c peroxidase
MNNTIKIGLVLITISFFVALNACKKDENGSDDDKTTKVELDKTPYLLDIGRFPKPPIASDNELTVQGVKLGRMLFYEKKLSGNATQSCASCHQQQFAFNDTAQFSIGIHGLQGKRNAMSVFNMAWNTNGFFWDGRAPLLRDQSLKPIQDALEMDETLANVVAKLKQSQVYKDQFIRAFGTDEITPELISKAMEQFMNSIVSNKSKYDAYRNGAAVLDSSEERGRRLFFLEYNQFIPEQSGADCAHCHSGDNFENDQFMNNGIKEDAAIIDIGRQAVTNKPNDKGKFKVPSLRNIELTAPYMSDGSIKTLEEVVEHYNTGLKSSSTLDAALEQTRGTGLRLTPKNKQDLVAFLKTLTDKELLINTAYNSPF